MTAIERLWLSTCWGALAALWFSVGVWPLGLFCTWACLLNLRMAWDARAAARGNAS